MVTVTMVRGERGGGGGDTHGRRVRARARSRARARGGDEDNRKKEEGRPRLLGGGVAIYPLFFGIGVASIPPSCLAEQPGSG